MACAMKIGFITPMGALTRVRMTSGAGAPDAQTPRRPLVT